MFLLVSVYIPDTLLNPLHKLTDIKESFDPFLANVIGHFGPLIVAFGTSQEDFSEELLVRIHQDLFFVDSKPIHLSESLFLFFETLVKSFPNHKSLVFLDKLIKMYLDSDGVLTEPEPSLKEIPYQILLCCKKDYNYMLSHLLTLHHHNLFDHLDLAYLFVQAKRSLNQRIHYTLLHFYPINLFEFETVIVLVLKTCYLDSGLIEKIRKMVIK